MRYLFDHLDQLAVWGDILQMSVLELIRKVWVRHCKGPQQSEGGDWACSPCRFLGGGGDGSDGSAGLVFLGGG